MGGKGDGRRLSGWIQGLQKQDLRRYVALAGATFLLLVGVFAVEQSWQIYQNGRVLHRLVEVRLQARASLIHEIAKTRQKLTQALSDPELQTDLQTADAAGRRRAAQRLRQLLPKLRQVEFFSPGLREVLHTDFNRFGYNKAAMLVRAQSIGAMVPVEVHGVSQARSMLLAAPVDSGLGRLGFVWVALPFSPLRARFDSIVTGGGKLLLRQSGQALLERGPRAMPGSFDLGRPIPGSRLQIEALPPAIFLLFPDDLPITLLSAFLALSVGILLLWSRVRQRQPDPNITEEPTLIDVLRNARTLQVKESQPKAAPGKENQLAAAQALPAGTIDRSIFRAYDIRGVVGSQLSSEVARLIGQAVGSLMHDQGLAEIVVGRDGRNSGEDLVNALADGLREAGCNVIDLGRVPTPVVYFATYTLHTGCGVAVTGSHNPPEYNGFKMVVGGETLSEQAIQELYARICEGRLVTTQRGSMQTRTVVAEYVERIVSDVQLERPLKVVADCGNGVAGEIVPELLEAIGAEVIPLYCEVDGAFPNHHPDPSDPANLRDLILSVQRMGADIGVAFDGDGDRLGVVTREGEIIYPDRLLMLFSADVLSRDPGATIIYDVKCTGHLQPAILRCGGVPLMWRTGHSLIKAKMRETEAALAGEMSGHFFFSERWYGFDDGLYAAARLLEILAADAGGRTPEQIFGALPKGASTPELKIAMEEGEHYAFIEKFVAQARFPAAHVTTLDGVRADWPDGFGLVRASNTTPVLVLRFDADNKIALERIKKVFRVQLQAVAPELKLPF